MTRPELQRASRSVMISISLRSLLERGVWLMVFVTIGFTKTERVTDLSKCDEVAGRIRLRPFNIHQYGVETKSIGWCLWPLWQSATQCRSCQQFQDVFFPRVWLKLRPIQRQTGQNPKYVFQGVRKSIMVILGTVLFPNIWYVLNYIIMSSQFQEFKMY